MGSRILLPREKLEQRGIDTLSDTDLVAVILGSGIDGKGVLDVARAVSKKLTGLIQDDRRLSWKECLEIEGIGRVKAMQLECAVELGRRLYGKGDAHSVIVKSRNDIKLMFSYLKKKRQEHVVVVSLDSRNRIIGRKTVAIGGLNKTVVEPRDIFSWAIQVGAASILLVHNHPSGDQKPSNADERFTQRISGAADLLGIPLLDHVVV